MSLHYILFDDVHYSYLGSSVEALKGISFRINHGDHVALLGLNGSGKSTLLLQTNGLLLPTKGKVTVGDIPVEKKTLRLVRRTIGMVFQNADDMLFMPTIGEDVAFGPRNMGLPEGEVQRRVFESLAAVGLGGMESRAAYSLSGGQRRAAAIASVLAMEPSILVLDEPTANLDFEARAQLVAILKRFSHSILLATHDLELALELCPRAVELNNGAVSFDGPTQDVTRRIRREYFGMQESK